MARKSKRSEGQTGLKIITALDAEMSRAKAHITMHNVELARIIALVHADYGRKAVRKVIHAEIQNCAEEASGLIHSAIVTAYDIVNRRRRLRELDSRIMQLYAYLGASKFIGKFMNDGVVFAVITEVESAA